MKKVQHEDSATRKKCKMKIVPNEKSNMKKVQHEENAAWRKCIIEKAKHEKRMQYEKCAAECNMNKVEKERKRAKFEKKCKRRVHKRITSRPLTDRYTLVQNYFQQAVLTM